MSAIDELIDAVHATGATLRADPPDLVIGNPDRVPADLEARLRENKAEILKRLELEASVRRLEAAKILIAVLEDGTMRVIQNDAEAGRAVKDGFTVYAPHEMLLYVTLTPHERRMLHSFKKAFGGTAEVKP